MGAIAGGLGLAAIFVDITRRSTTDSTPTLNGSDSVTTALTFPTLCDMRQLAARRGRQRILRLEFGDLVGAVIAHRYTTPGPCPGPGVVPRLTRHAAAGGGLNVAGSVFAGRCSEWDSEKWVQGTRAQPASVS